MMPKATDSKILGDGERTTLGNDPDAAGHEAGTLAGAHQLVARLARLDLDAETLEMLMAALTTEDCDQVNVADA